MIGSLAFLAVALAVLGMLGSILAPRMRPVLLLVVTSIAAVVITMDGFWTRASAYDLLRKPSFAAIGVWLALVALLAGRDLSPGAIAGLAVRSLTALALVGAAALATYAVARVDPFDVDLQRLPSAHALLGLMLLGAALAVGTSSFAAIGPRRAAFDFAASLVAATCIAGPLFPGFTLLPEGLTGEIAIALAAAAGALGLVGALASRRPIAWLGVALAVALAIVAPAGFVLILEKVSSWFIA